MFSTGIFIHLIYKMMILDSSYTAKCFWGGLEHIDGIFLLYYNFWYMYFDVLWAVIAYWFSSILKGL